MENRVVLISGVSSGIGLATAKKYIMEGNTVCGIDINNIPLTSGIDFYMCDISDECAVKSVFTQISKKYTYINYVINCAGIFFDKARYTIDEMNLQEFERVLSINLIGTVLVTKYAIPLLKLAPEERAIVNVSSDQVFYPRKRNSAYAVSKAGISNFSLACAVELLEEKIRVNSVIPASVRSGFLRNLEHNGADIVEIYEKENNRMPFGIIEPEDIAELIYFLGSEKSRKITGQSMMVNSGLYI